MSTPTPRHYWLELLVGPAATLAGIVVAAAGVIYTVHANDQAQRRQTNSAAAASFQLTAAQIVMGQRTCALAATRAKELVRLFPSRLNTPEFRRFRRPSKKICAELKRSQGSTGGVGSFPLLPFFPFG